MIARPLSLRLALLLPVATLVLFAVWAAPSSWADSGHRKDPAGDAADFLDIRGYSVHNGAHRVVMRMTVPELGERGRFGFRYDRKPYVGLAIGIDRRAGGRVSVDMQDCGTDSCTPVRCRGVRARWSIAEHVVSATFPQSCYPGRPPAVGSFLAVSSMGSLYDDAGRLRVRRG